MKLNKKFIAVPAIALAAGLGLAACGSAKAPAAAPVVTHTVTAPAATPKPSATKATPAPKATTAPATPTSAAALPTVATDWAIDPPDYVVEPSTIGTAADGNGEITGITWSSWTASNAEGSGSIDLNNCAPNCAQGTRVNVPVTIGLTNPVNGSFTAMAVADSAGNESTYHIGGSGNTYGLSVDDPAPAASASSTDPWSVAEAYTNDVNSGDVSDAWNLLGPSVQAGWDGYSAFASWVGQTTFSNVYESSESGDAVVFTFSLSNSAGTDVSYTATFTVDNGIITSSTSSPSS